MHDAIRGFSRQFAFEPEIANHGKLKPAGKFLVLGMGGSQLAASLLKVSHPSLDVAVHQDYGLPAGDLSGRLVIASSYSGNTEEVLDGFHQALQRGLPLAAISVGGRLLELAKAHSVPYIQLPDTGIPPRVAVGYMYKAFLRLLGQQEALREVGKLAASLDPSSHEAGGRELAEKLKGRVPVIYSSSRNAPIAYNWKVRFNETGKVPAFHNVLPEANHNELAGFDVTAATKALSEKFHFIFLRDSADHPRINRRMDILERVYREKGFPVEVVDLEGPDVHHKIFSSLLLADWAAYHKARNYGIDPAQTDLQEEFKRLI